MFYVLIYEKILIIVRWEIAQSQERNYLLKEKKTQA